MLACAEKFEDKLAAALKAQGYTMKRAHKIDGARGHGFISSQREGCDMFAAIDPDAPLLCY